jgi:3-oxoacyl-[acyl-carrier protein] reductase
MNVVVTGSGKGIGLEIVRIMSGYEGFRIFALSRNTLRIENLKTKLTKGQVIPVSIDLTQLNNKKNQLDFLGENDTIDILVNNAGKLENKRTGDFQLEDLENIFGVNVYAPILLVQQLLNKFNPKGAHIVNIGSMGGYQGSSKFPGLSVYSASKGALAIWTECLATELEPSNIKCNCLALGSVQTEMLEAAFPGYKAPLTANEMAQYIVDFALNGHRFFNGKILPVSIANP